MKSGGGYSPMGYQELAENSVGAQSGRRGIGHPYLRSPAPSLGVFRSRLRDHLRSGVRSPGSLFPARAGFRYPLGARGVLHRALRSIGRTRSSRGAWAYSGQGPLRLLWTSVADRRPTSVLLRRRGRCASPSLLGARRLSPRQGRSFAPAVAVCSPAYLQRCVGGQLSIHYLRCGSSGIRSRRRGTCAGME
jgi:hypothetical protein